MYYHDPTPQADENDSAEIDSEVEHMLALLEADEEASRDYAVPVDDSATTAW